MGSKREKNTPTYGSVPIMAPLMYVCVLIWHSTTHQHCNTITPVSSKCLCCTLVILETRKRSIIERKNPRWCRQVYKWCIVRHQVEMQLRFVANSNTLVPTYDGPHQRQCFRHFQRHWQSLTVTLFCYCQGHRLCSEHFAVLRPNLWRRRTLGTT